MIHIHTYIYIYTNIYDTAFSSCFYQYITDDNFSVHILAVSINIYIYISPSAIYAFSVDAKFSLPRKEVIFYPDILLCHTRRASTLDCEKCGIRTRYSQLPQQFVVLPHVFLTTWQTVSKITIATFLRLFYLFFLVLIKHVVLLESKYDLFLSLINFNLISLFQEI